MSHGLNPRAIPTTNTILTSIHFLSALTQFCHRDIAILTIPSIPHPSVILCMRSLLSTGSQTFILDQSPPPVNIARKMKKKPIHPNIPMRRYAISASTAMMSISVVNLIEKAIPTSIPTIPRSM